jgi:ribosomal-protein-alanine N-acetyltransferase
VFFRSSEYFDPGKLLDGGAVFLRMPEAGDYPAWAALREASRDFLTPWEPTWPHDDLTRAAFRYRLKRYHRDLQADEGYAFFIFRRHDRRLVGGLTLSSVRRGVAQSASLGYWIGQEFARQGFMTAAVKAVIPFAFDILKLHRLEAACLPSNAASLALLRRTGFAEEGFARSYLKINGRWQDHVLFAIIADDPRP